MSTSMSKAAAEVSAESLPQLSFQINNPNAPNTIYVTADPTVNKLTLLIKTNTDGTVFTPGQLVPESQAQSANGSILYLDLTSLDMLPQEFSGLKFTADGWAFQEFSGDGKQLICFAPTEEIMLGSDGAIQIRIDNLVMSKPPAGGSTTLVTISYRVQPVTVGNISTPTFFGVLLQSPPNTHDQDLHEALNLTVDNHKLVNSIPSYRDVINSLGLDFGPGENSRTIIASMETSFIVSFVYSTDDNDGYGALTTPQRGTTISVERGTGAENWSITPGPDQQNPSWLLQPNPTGQPNQPILGSGQSTVEFLIGNIVTTFQPGPTLMLISYSGVPGYRDGSYAIPLEKVPHVDIQSFIVTPDPAILDGDTALVTVSWVVFNAGTVILSSASEGSMNVSGQSSSIATISGGTVFTLDAQGTSLADAGNVAIKNITAKVLPVINSFEASPASIYYDDFPHDVSLAWNVNTNLSVTIDSTVGQNDGTLRQPLGGLTRSITQPQMLTLSTVGDGNDDTIPVSRNIVLSAFTLENEALIRFRPARSVACSPNAGFIVTADPSDNHLYVLDTVTYQQMGEAIPTPGAPRSVAFSPDGSLIYVVSGAVLSMIEVQPTGSIPPYSFRMRQQIPTGGESYDLAVSPGGRYVYIISLIACAFDEAFCGLLTVLEHTESGNLSQLTTFVTHPFAANLYWELRVAVAPSGRQVFVSSQDSGCITVFNVSSSGEHTLSRNIQITTPEAGHMTGPSGIAVTSDSRMLMVACSLAPSIVVIDLESWETRKFPVGPGAWQIAAAAEGTYAFASNPGNDSISLLSYDTSSLSIKVVDTIGVPGWADDITVSPDSSVVFVGNPTFIPWSQALNSKIMGVLALSQYQEQTTPIPVGNTPTSVAVSPDGSRVFIWHNSLLNIQGASPSTGFYAYDTASKSVTQQMAGESVVACLFSPISGSNTAFVTAAEQKDIAVINAKTYETVGTLAIPQVPSGSDRVPRNLAISADGTVLFAIVYDRQQQYSLVVFELSDKPRLAADVRLFTASNETVTLLCASPDGSGVFAVNSVDNQLWKAERNDAGSYTVQPAPAALGGTPSAMAMLPDGSKLYVLNKQGSTNSISVVNAASLEVDTTFLPREISTISLNDIAISPDGTKILATDSVKSCIRVIDRKSLRMVQTIFWQSGVQEPIGLAMIPDGSQFFTANANSNNLGIVRQIQPSIKR